jgi:RNA polymerase sigma-70 factor (ECF subfamily)
MTTEAQVRGHLARGDNREAAASALRAVGPEVLGYLESLVGDPDDARDVFQAFAEELWRWLPTWRGEGALRAWCYQRGAWQRRRQRLRTTMASRIAASLASESRAGGRRDRLWRLRQSLEPEERTLLVLRLDRELPWEEVALVLSREGEAPEPAALRKRFERLKDKLARMARQQGLVDEEA